MMVPSKTWISDQFRSHKELINHSWYCHQYVQGMRSSPLPTTKVHDSLSTLLFSLLMQTYIVFGFRFVDRIIIGSPKDTFLEGSLADWDPWGARIDIVKTLA